MPTAHTPQPKPWPQILQRYVDEVGSADADQHPRRIVRRYHGIDVTMWQGRVHVDDVDGWVENVRLKHYLRSWQQRRGDFQARPSTDDIYEIMVDADRVETKESAKPFQIDRLARSIASNGIQEPVVLFIGDDGVGKLWDGNRRFYATKHVMCSAPFAAARESAKWIPALVYQPSGDPTRDERIHKAILTELNFKEKDHIPWPSYVKAGEIHDVYQQLVASDPSDPRLRREARQQIAEEYGLKSWRQADRWIKMYGLAMDFKEYFETEHGIPETEIELRIQEKFEYFDELTKSGVWGSLSHDPDARDEVFRWLWDGKFKSFADVRSVPKILTDPVARIQANQDDADAVKRAIETVIVNDPVRAKDKTAADAKIRQFAEWLGSFRPEEFKSLETGTLERLQQMLDTVTAMLEGLQARHPASAETAGEPA
jgi:hypothetical protein